jgi:NADPH2:quinone reductase
MFVSYGAASGAVPPFDIALLAQKGSLFVTRPTLMTYSATRPALLAMADDMFKLVLAGKIKSEARQRFALKDATAAHRALESRATTGATVLIP